MNTNTIAVYTDDPVSNKIIISRIKDYINNNYQYSDFVLMSNNNYSDQSIDISILPNFYLKFFLGSVIFLDLEDYVLYSDSIMGHSILYLESKNTNNIDRNIIKNCDILTDINNNLTIIKNHELQQTI